MDNALESCTDTLADGVARKRSRYVRMTLNSLAATAAAAMVSKITTLRTPRDVELVEVLRICSAVESRDEGEDEVTAMMAYEERKTRRLPKSKQMRRGVNMSRCMLSLLHVSCI